MPRSHSCSLNRPALCGGCEAGAVGLDRPLSMACRSLLVFSAHQLCRLFVVSAPDVPFQRHTTFWLHRTAFMCGSRLNDRLPNPEPPRAFSELTPAEAELTRQPAPISGPMGMQGYSSSRGPCSQSRPGCRFAPNQGAVWPGEADARACLAACPSRCYAWMRRM